MWFIKDLYEDEISASVQQLAVKYKVPRVHFFRYLQLRDCVRKKYDSFPNVEPTTAHKKGVISRIRGTAAEMNRQSIDSLRTRWEQGTGLQAPPLNQTSRTPDVEPTCDAGNSVHMLKTKTTSLSSEKLSVDIRGRCERFHFIVFFIFPQSRNRSCQTLSRLQTDRSFRIKVLKNAKGSQDKVKL